MASGTVSASRRQLLAGMLGACGASALLAACGSSGSTAATASASAAGAASTSAAAGSATSVSTSVVASSTAAASTARAATSASAKPLPTPSSRSVLKAGLTKVEYLCVFSSGTSYDEYVTLFNQFNQQNDKIQVEVLPGTNSFVTTREKVLVAHAAGGDAGDFYENGWGPFTDMADEQVIADLSTIIAADKFDTTIFIPNVLQAWQYNGKQWAIPPFVAADAIGYNMDLFDAAGLKYPPTDPTDTSWTMETFLDTATKLTRTGTQWGYGGGITCYNQAGVTAGTFFGEQPWDDTQKKSLMDTDTFKKGLQYFYDLTDKKYHVQPNADESKGFPTGLDSNLESGKIGLTVICGRLNKAKIKNRLALGTSPYSGPAPNQSGRFFADGLHIDNNSKVKSETFEVFKWLMTPNPNAAYALALGQSVSSLKAGNPAMSKAYQDATGLDPKAFNLQAQYSHNSGNGLLKYANWAKVLSQINPLYADFNSGKIDVNTYANQAAIFINKGILTPTAGVELHLASAASPAAPENAGRCGCVSLA